MSQENVELMGRIVGAFNAFMRGDLTTADYAAGLSE